MNAGGAVPFGWRGDPAAREIVALPIEVARSHSLVLGKSGAGKTYFVTSVFQSLLRRRNAPCCVLVDLKGEAATLGRNLTLLNDLEPRVRPEEVCVIAPWDGAYGVPLNVLAPVPGMDRAIQAAMVAELVAAFSDDLSVRMTTCLRPLLLAVMEQGPPGSLLDVRDALVGEALAKRLAAHVADPDVRQFLERTLWSPQLAKTRESLRYRLDELLALPNLRAMLCSAKGSIDPAALLSSRLAIVDLSSSQVGLGRASVFVGRWVFTLLAAAIFRRDPSGTEHPAWVFVDEWQLLARHLAESFADILSLARSRNVGLCLANQYAGQISAASPALWEGVQVNLAWRALFHPDPAALRDIAAYLPHTGAVVDPKRPDRLLDAHAEREAIARILTTQPPRRAVLVNEKSSDSIALLSTFTLPVARARATWEALSPEEKARWARGKYGVPFAELAPKRLALPEVEAGAAPESEPGGSPVPRAGKTRFPRGRSGGLVLGPTDGRKAP